MSEFCKICGLEVEDGTIYCPKCDSAIVLPVELEEPEALPAENGLMRRAKIRAAILAAVATVLLLVTVAVLLPLLPDSHTSEQGTAYTVKVVNASGSPVPGVTVTFSYLEQDAAISGKTDADGSLSMHIPEEKVVFVQLGNLPNAYRNWEDMRFQFSEGMKNLTITLYPEGSYTLYTVKVEDALGEPVPGVKLSIGYAMFSSMPNVFYTDVDGYVYYPTTLSHAGSLCVNVEEIPNGYPLPERIYMFWQENSEMTIRLTNQPITYSVSFIDEAGEPVEGVSVQIGMIYASYHQEYSTSASGQITIPSDANSPYSITIQSVPPGYRMPAKTYFTLSAEQPDIVITLEHSDGEAEYTVRVVNEDGEPVEGVRVSIGSVAASYHPKYSTNARGMIVIAYEEMPGTLPLSVSVISVPDGYGCPKDTYTLSGESPELEIVLTRE